MSQFLPVTLLMIALAAAGCGNDDVTRSGEGVDHVTFEEALTYSSDTPVTVSGYFFKEGDRARLCAALAESHPPQCGGAELEVVSLPAEVPEMNEAQNGRIKWLDKQVTVRGVISGGEIAIGHFVD